MKIDKLIQELEKVKEEHGNLEVIEDGAYYGQVSLKNIRVGEVAKLKDTSIDNNKFDIDVDKLEIGQKFLWI